MEARLLGYFMCGNLIYQLQSVVNYLQKNLDELAQLLNLQTIFYLDQKLKTNCKERDFNAENLGHVI